MELIQQISNDVRDRLKAVGIGVDRGPFIFRRWPSIALLLICGWVFGSIDALLSADPILFQRYGSLGVAAGVVFLISVRAEQDNHRKLADALMFRAICLQMIESKAHSLFLESRVSKIDGKEVSLDEDSRAALRKIGDDMFMSAEYHVGLLLREVEAKTLNRFLGVQAVAIEVLIIVTGTMQWGFGDLAAERLTSLL
ncbi:MAG: hypothetical protein WBA67_00585 [Jannaschia sp.]